MSDIGTRTAAELVRSMEHTSAGPLCRFVGARLAEDEAASKPLAERLAESGWTSEDDAWDQMGPSGVYEWGTCNAAVRKLRWVEAGCRILWEYVNCGDGYEAGPGLHVAMLALAAIWSDHADYDARWQETDW